MRSNPEHQKRPEIKYRPGVKRPDRRKRINTRDRKTPARQLCEVDCDLPEPLPATIGEVVVIETYRADLVDDLLAKCSS